MRAHLATGELLAATPTASHPQLSWAPDEIECRVLLMLPYTNPTPALAASLRHTMTAERQRGAVVLPSINILAAAPTDRHMGDASRMADLIEQPMFGRGFLQLFHFTAGLERKPAFPSRWRGPGSIAGGVPRGMGAADLACAAVCAARVGARTQPSTSSLGGPCSLVVYGIGAS